MPTLSDEEITNRFTYHAPSDEGIKRHSDLSVSLQCAARIVRDTCPDSRERSLALTKLEEAKFWASAAVARHEETR